MTIRDLWVAYWLMVGGLIVQTVAAFAHSAAMWVTFPLALLLVFRYYRVKRAYDKENPR